MQIKILRSDYITFKKAIGHVVNARPSGFGGWMIKVSESFKFDDESAWIFRNNEDYELFFRSLEVEEVKEVKSPFAFWNKLKSGALHAEL